VETAREGETVRDRNGGGVEAKNKASRWGEKAVEKSAKGARGSKRQEGTETTRETRGADRTGRDTERKKWGSISRRRVSKTPGGKKD